MSASISIPSYPSSNLVPGFYFAVDATGANTASATQRTLLIGQMTAAGMATPGLAVIVPSNPAVAMFGPGSQLTRMAARHRAINTTGEVWALPLLDDPASVAAAGSIVVTGTATAAGTLSLYLDDVLIPVLVNVGETAALVAAAIVAAVAAAPTAPPLSAALSAAGSATVNLTAVNKGLAGNDLQVALNYLGTAGGQSTPAGITLAITQPTGGAQNPSTLATALAALGDKPFDHIGHPYNDPTSLNAFKAFLNTTSGRWSPTSQLFGRHYTGVRGTLGQVTALTPANDPFGSILPIADSPASPLNWAAEATAVIAISVLNNPAIPISGENAALNVDPPTLLNRFTRSERQSLLQDGFASYTVGDDNSVKLERVVATYTTNAQGQPDNSWQDVETGYILMAAIRDFQSFIASNFSNKILVADGTVIPGGSPATTAQLVLQAVIGRYRTHANVFFWAQNPSTFAKNAVGQNAGNGVVKLLLPYEVADQLFIIASDVAFSKP